MSHTLDPHDLNRFPQAQEHDCARALAEPRAGRKHTHWMWSIFPRIDGLGFSPKARRYAIRNLDETCMNWVGPLPGDRVSHLREHAFHSIWMRPCCTIGRAAPSRAAVILVLSSSAYKHLRHIASVVPVSERDQEALTN